MTKNEAIQKVLTIAENEVGYLEKKNGNNLDHKTANAGSANYTKYGYEMHNLYPKVMDYPAAWCCAFVSWILYKAFGMDKAKQLMCGDIDDYTVAAAARYKTRSVISKRLKLAIKFSSKMLFEFVTRVLFIKSIPQKCILLRGIRVPVLPLLKMAEVYSKRVIFSPTLELMGMDVPIGAVSHRKRILGILRLHPDLP